MPLSAVPYPGGKTNHAKWIQQYLPDHDCYVEPMAGSAAVLLNKPRSRIEVLNDANECVTTFFRVAKQRPDELRERLTAEPYARETHEEWIEHVRTGEWPDDELEHAARWFYLRYSQHSAKLTGASGWKSAKKTNPASAYRSGVKRLPTIAARLERVQIESGDWRDLVERYDGPETAWYFDPPYVDDGEELYPGRFDHAAFVKTLAELEGEWLVSYEELPEGLADVSADVKKTDTERAGSAREGEGRKKAKERLALSFNPETAPEFTQASQSTLTEMT